MALYWLLYRLLFSNQNCSPHLRRYTELLLARSTGAARLKAKPLQVEAAPARWRLASSIGTAAIDLGPDGSQAAPADNGATWNAFKMKYHGARSHSDDPP